MKYKNLIFLGTSHIARQSLREVEEHIERERPYMLALELDRKRIAALMSKTPKKAGIGSIRRIGFKGFLFSLFGAWAERKLGKLVGVAPGSEMKKAIKIARKNNIKVALIDQDIEITLRRLSESITWKEKVNFFADITKAFFIRKGELEFDLATVPERKIIKKLVDNLKKRYPNFYRVLIEERNAVIAKNIRSLMLSEPDKKILVILGAGHVDEVAELVKSEPRISYTFSTA